MTQKSSGKSWADVVKTQAPPSTVPVSTRTARTKTYAYELYDEDCGECFYKVHYELLGWKKRGERIADISKRFDDDLEFSNYNAFADEVLKTHYNRIIPAYEELLDRVWEKKEFKKFRAADNDSNAFWREMDFGEEWNYEEHLEKIAEHGLKELFDQFKLLSKCCGRFHRNHWNEDCHRHASILKTDQVANVHVCEAMDVLKREFLRFTNNKCSHCCKTVDLNRPCSSAMCGTCGFVMCEDCLNYESDRIGRNCVFCLGSV